MRSKTLALVQSSYIPWKGYFDLINLADEFLLFDDVQYTSRDWRNRNRIKTRSGTAWLSIPVHTKGNSRQPIKTITVSDPCWAERHWKTLVHNYRQAKHFDRYADQLQRLYLGMTETRLSAVNYVFIRAICDLLGITTTLRWSMEFSLLSGKTERIVDLCVQTGATRYLSGPSARAYLDPRQFEDAQIELAFIDYSAYPEYEQLFPPFIHGVTALDLIFNEGPNASRFMLSFGAQPLRTPER